MRFFAETYIHDISGNSRRKSSTDEVGSCVSFGPIVDTATKINLTEGFLQDSSKSVYKGLSLKGAIKTVKGDGPRVIETFEDPHCGFCRQLMTEVGKLNNVTICTFHIPVVGPDSAVKATAIWCTKDQSFTWTGFMTGKVQLPATLTGHFETPIECNNVLQAKLRITGTPAILFPDNTKTPDYITADPIEAKFRKQAAQHWRRPRCSRSSNTNGTSPPAPH